MNSRRKFLATTSVVSAMAFSADGFGQQPASAGPDTGVAGDIGARMKTFEQAQAVLGEFYGVDRQVANLENAYYGVMARPVQQAYYRHLDFQNQHHTAYFRRATQGRNLDADLERSTGAVAGLIGARKEEIALCGGGTDALYALITGYAKLKPGDSVIFADIDYDEMQYAMEFLKEFRSVNVVQFAAPEPATTANVLQAYEAVLDRTPRAKLLLLTHLGHRTGLVPPVAEIIGMARKRGVDVILDVAQTVGHLEVDVDALGVDFAGFSLHKWVGAPLGTGAIYIRKERLADIAPLLGNKVFPATETRARLSSGTANVPSQLAIMDAIDFHKRIGGARKTAHLVALRDHWVERVRDIAQVEILVPNEPGRYGAVTSFRLKGMKRYEDAQQLQRVLLQKHGVLVVARRGLASGLPAIRVTPALYNTSAELDKLVNGLKAERSMFG